MTIRRLVAMLGMVGLAGACGGGGGEKHREVNVFAAASLTEVFNDMKSQLPPLRPAYNFAGSQALVTQIQQGAPADVFASADQKNMQKLLDGGLVDPPTVFAHNKLEIVVARGNPQGVTGLADLARDNLLVVLADPSVPAGNYSQQALQKAGVTVKPRSLELDVKAALAKVITGEADASIVYASDVKSASTKADGVSIPDAQNVVAAYPIAVVRAAHHRDAAKQFIRELRSVFGRRVLQEHGFTPA